MMTRNEKLLRKVLTPLIHSESTRIDSFLEDDMEGYIKAVIAFQIEAQVIEYVKAHPNASAQELYHLIPEGVPAGQEDEDDLDMSEFSEYHQLLLTRYDRPNLDEEERDILYFLIGNPQHIGVEERALSSMKAHPEDTLVDFYERYIEEVIPSEYRIELGEKLGWKLEE
nr:MAG TPA: hypothetical protein [Caudoviricetes sp.]